MEIAFTQYLMPDGRPKRITIDRSDKVAEMANGLLEQGCKLAIEVLTTRQVSMTIEREDESDEGTEVLSHYICDNGPGLEDYVDKLIVEATAKIKECEHDHTT